MGVKKRLYRWCISAIALIALVTAAWGAAPDGPNITSAMIGKKELKGTTEVTIIKNDLIRNREALILGTADGGGYRVEKVEISLNGGQTWNDVTGRENWQYRFVPAPNYTYHLTFRVTNADAIVSDHREFGITRLTYLPITLSELIQQQVDELARAYMAKDRDRYMGFISRGYQNYPRGWQQMRRTIENDFKSLNNIALRFTVNQVFEIEKVIMADIHWRLTYAGLPEPKEGYVEIHFDPADQLKILVQKKDLYFGAAPIGHDGRVQLVPFAVGDNVRVIVTDLDKVGIQRVTVQIRVTGSYGPFTGTMTLVETPPRSGRFEGLRLGVASEGDTFSATYIDEITADWRRDVRRSDTYVVP